MLNKKLTTTLCVGGIFFPNLKDIWANLHQSCPLDSVQWGREGDHPPLKLRSWVVSSCWLRLWLASGRSTTTRRDLLLQIRQIQFLFGQIYFTSKTNTHCNLDKFDKTQLVHICIIVRQSESYPRLGLVYYCSCFLWNFLTLPSFNLLPIILQEPFKRCDVCILTKRFPQRAIKLSQQEKFGKMVIVTNQ